MNPVIVAVQHFYQIHPIVTIILGVVFFPEIELVILGLALLAFLATH